jgi:hypothetical protein
MYVYVYLNFIKPLKVTRFVAIHVFYCTHIVISDSLCPEKKTADLICFAYQKIDTTTTTTTATTKTTTTTTTTKEVITETKTCITVLLVVTILCVARYSRNKLSVFFKP